MIRLLFVGDGDRDAAMNPPLVKVLTGSEVEATLPTALGCANPHAEAWLLDDPVAVRDALELDADTIVPSFRKTKSPKGALAGLISQSRKADVSIRRILAEIAQRLDPVRCAHKDEAGFAAFAADVREEIGPWSSVR